MKPVARLYAGHLIRRQKTDLVVADRNTGDPPDGTSLPVIDG